MTSPPTQAVPEKVEFVIKNPARSTDPPFTLQTTANSNVSDLKKQLHTEYYGKPDPQSQTVQRLRSVYPVFAVVEKL